MSASSSDSWILIALTILVVLLLFYLSKKMICNSYGSTSGESPVATPSPSSTSTSFSDYGQSPLDSDPSSPDTDHLTIDIADSTDYHYRVDNSSCNNNNTNNINLSNTVTSNGRGRPMGFGGSPPLSTQPILFPISIIASTNLDQKTMLEAQLRNQIAKIVHAEREIQRLAQLLSIEQGLDCQGLIAAATLQAHHAAGILSPSVNSASSSSSRAEATVATSVPETLPFQHLPSSLPMNSTINSGYSTNSAYISVVDPSPIDNNNVEDDAANDHQNNVPKATSPGNREQNGGFSYLSDFLASSNSTRCPHQLSCGSHTNVSGSRHSCRCNLCYPNTSARMLMLRRLLHFPIVQTGNTVTTTVGTGGANDFLVRSVASSNLHYQQLPPLTAQSPQLETNTCHPVRPDPRSSMCESSLQHHHHNHLPFQEDNPPAYEECIRSSNYKQDNLVNLQQQG